jgi:hypothetical protein
MIKIHSIDIVSRIREGLNDYSSAKVLGTDTTGPYSNATIFYNLGGATREIANIISRRNPGIFTVETSIPAVNSVIALPPDFGKIQLLRDQYGLKVSPIAQDQRHYTQWEGSQLHYYRKADNLVIDKDGCTDTFSLVYTRIPREIHHGLLLVDYPQIPPIPLNATYLQKPPASTVDEYYTGMEFKDLTQDFNGIVLDYRGVDGKITFMGMTEQLVAGDQYAFYPDMPGWTHDIVVQRATLMLKQLPFSQFKPTKEDFDSYAIHLRTIINEYVSAGDDDLEWFKQW